MASLTVRLFVVLLLLSILSVVNRVFRKKMIDAYGSKYSFFRQELTNLLYNLWVTGIVTGKWLRGDYVYDDKHTSGRGDEEKGGPSSAVRATSLALLPRLAIISLCDSSSDFLSSIGGVYTPGGLQVLLTQAGVVFIMAASALAFGTRYSWAAVAGALITVGGAALAVGPGIASGSSNTIRWFAVLLFASSNIPVAGSYLASEFFMKRFDIDYYYLTCVTSWMQLGLTWILVPLTALHGFGGVPMHEIPFEFRQGFRCFIGNTSVPVLDPSGGVIGYCSTYNTWITFAFSLTGFVAGILQLHVLKFASKASALVSVASSLQVPIAGIVFSSHAIMGSSAEPLTAYYLGGLALTSLGFLVYSLFMQRGTEGSMTAIVRVDEVDASPLLEEPLLHQGASINNSSSNNGKVAHTTGK